jgi:hypothetical protein
MQTAEVRAEETEGATRRPHVIVSGVAYAVKMQGTTPFNRHPATSKSPRLGYACRGTYYYRSDRVAPRGATVYGV